MNSYVYFLRPIGMDGPVKIGCSAAPESRLDIYLLWSPFPLEIAARIPGDHGLEARFHNRFIAQRTHHEWFAASPDLTATIEAIQRKAFDIETLPGGPRKGWAKVREPWSRETRLRVSMSRRIESLQKRGVQLPNDVKLAERRYGAGRYSPHHNPQCAFDPADEKLICDFLDRHGERPPLARAA